MHHPTLPKITVFLLICLMFSSVRINGQEKPLGEIEVNKCWSYHISEGIGSTLSTDDTRIYLGLGGGRIDALSPDGKKIWTTELGGEVTSNVIPFQSTLLLVTTPISGDVAPGESRLRSLTKDTGITNWSMQLSGSTRHFLNVFNDDVIVISNNGIIQSVDAKSGNLKWKREIAKAFVAEPAFHGDKAFVASVGNQIFGISLASGEIDSVRKVPFAITAMSFSTNGELIMGDDRGTVSSLKALNKTNWKFKSGGEISTVLPTRGHILATSHDNFVYFLVNRNGGRSWKKRLSGRVAQVGTILDRYALVSSSEEAEAILIDLATGKVSGQLALDAGEILVQRPLTSNGLILILTNRAVSAYGLNTCSVKKNDGPDIKPATADLK